MVKIPGSELALAQQGRRRAYDDRFHRRNQDADGNTETNIRDKMDIKLSDATAAAVFCGVREFVPRRGFGALDEAGFFD